jgi:hypothetical protein
MSSTRHAIEWALILALGGCAPALAADPDRAPAAPRALCESGTEARLRFLEEHLEGRRTYADLWWKGWNTVYAGGIVVEGVRAGLEDDRGERADRIVGAVKSGIGLAQNLWSPPPARLGASELDDLPTDSPEGCAQRLARAEEILRRNAEASHDERRSWIPHLGNLGLNLAGALIVAKGFDERSGWGSGALGFAVGEVRIWSYPWHAGGALEEYERRFPASGVPQGPPTTWRIESWAGGARVVLRY